MVKKSWLVSYSLDSDPFLVSVVLDLFETNIIGRSCLNWSHQVSTGLAKSQLVSMSLGETFIRKFLGHDFVAKII